MAQGSGDAKGKMKISITFTGIVADDDSAKAWFRAMDDVMLPDGVEPVSGQVEEIMGETPLTEFRRGIETSWRRNT